MFIDTNILKLLRRNTVNTVTWEISLFREYIN